VKQEQEEQSFDWLNAGLWLVKFAVLFTSARHVAEAFLSLENAGTHAFWGWLPALATDGGLLFMAWKLKSDSKSKILWGGFIWFLVMSAFAQIDHAIQNVNFTGDWLYDGWVVVKIGLFAFSLPFLVAFMVVVASKRHTATEPQPQVPTALATTTNHVANQPQQPTVNVAPVPQQLQQQPRRERQQHRLKRPQPALPTLPTMPVLQQQPQQPVANSTHKSSQQPPQQPDNELVEELVFANQQPLQGLPIPTTQLAKSLAEAVVVYAGASSYDKAGARLNVSGEWIRKQVQQAYKEDPVWVAQILPAERLPK